MQQKRVNHVVEADIKRFFDDANHGWMVKFLQHRIGDPRIIRLIGRMLKGGILEEGLVLATEAGTTQGSILSPLLSNIYLHYALDLWFSRKIRKQCRGEAYHFRFADDFLACFQYRDEADAFLHQLPDRLGGFGLRLAAEKTRCIEFGRFSRDNAYKRGEKPKEFIFLGFTHYCGKTKEGHFKVKTPHESQEARAEPAQLCRLGTDRPTSGEERRDAAPGQGPRRRAPQLLRHHG